jgi:hypothetical protein
VVLLDRETNKEVETRLFVAYEHVDSSGSVLGEDWNQVDVESLMSYFYAMHHCPCHRKNDARHQGGVDVTDEECEGDRFPIARIVSVDVPDLILYSETLTEEQLEAALLLLKHGCP